MARPIEPGDWRILHGDFRDDGANLTIIATRLSAPPRVSRISRAVRGMRALLRSPYKESGISRRLSLSARANMSKA